MIKKLLTALILIPLTSYASNNEFPFDPNSRGIIMISSSNNVLKENEPKDFIQEYNDRYVKFLLNIKNNSSNEIKEYHNSNDKLDTHLKNHYSEIKLSIPFNEIKDIKPENIIGYAPGGSYQNGWDGIKIFFNDEQIGSCAYSKNKILSIQMEKETTEYIVNNKPSFKIITGNYESGFINNVSWYTDKKDHVIYEQIDCASKKLDKNVLDNMVLLANKIDKQV